MKTAYTNPNYPNVTAAMAEQQRLLQAAALLERLGPAITEEAGAIKFQPDASEPCGKLLCDVQAWLGSPVTEIQDVTEDAEQETAPAVAE